MGNLALEETPRIRERYNEDNATHYETLELFGMTAPDQVYKHAREHLASVRMRPEIHSFYVDIENLVATRGDLIKFNHDVPLFGIASGRVKNITDDGGEPAQVTHVTLDELVGMEAGKSYRVRFRLSDGSTLLKSVKRNAGETKTLEFTTPFDLIDAPEATLYTNGVLMIGQYQDYLGGTYGGYAFEGNIENFAMLDHALSSSEVSENIDLSLVTHNFSFEGTPPHIMFTSRTARSGISKCSKSLHSIT